MTGSLDSYLFGPSNGMDDTANINTFLDGLSPGESMILDSGGYFISAPIIIPNGVTFGGLNPAPALPSSTPISGMTWLSLLPGFSGAAAIILNSVNQTSIRNLAIYGAAASGSIDGIQIQGACLDTTIEHVLVQSMPGNGISSTGNGANTVRGLHVTVHRAGAIGFTCNITDSTWIDCLSLGAGAQGWFIGSGNANSKFIGCRSEFSGTYGFQVSGSWNTGTGAGGPQFIGCSTDRNQQSGMFISAIGTSPVVISNHMARRDGSSSTTQYAGMEISSATIPVIITGLAVYPGVDDTGGGNLSPWTGLNSSGSSTFISVTNAMLHAATQGLNGTAPFGLTSYRGIATRTGSTSSPSAITLIADSA